MTPKQRVLLILGIVVLILAVFSVTGYYISRVFIRNKWELMAEAEASIAEARELESKGNWEDAEKKLLEAENLLDEIMEQSPGAAGACEKRADIYIVRSGYWVSADPDLSIKHAESAEYWYKRAMRNYPAELKLRPAVKLCNLYEKYLNRYRFRSITSIRSVSSDVLSKMSRPVPGDDDYEVKIAKWVELNDYMAESILRYAQIMEERAAPVGLRIPFEKFASGDVAAHPYYNPEDANNNRYSMTEDGKTRLDIELVDEDGDAGWIGFREAVSVDVLEAADNDDCLNIRYYRRGKDEGPEDITRRDKNVLAYVSYHGSAVTAVNSGAIYYPDECWPVGDYESISSEVRTIRVEGYCGGEVDVICCIYRGKKSKMIVSEPWIMVLYHMNNYGFAVVDSNPDKILSRWEPPTDKRVGFLAQVQLNTDMGILPRGFDPGKPKDEKQMKKYEQLKERSWERLEKMGALFLKKLGRYLPEPAGN